MEVKNFWFPEVTDLLSQEVQYCHAHTTFWNNELPWIPFGKHPTVWLVWRKETVGLQSQVHLTPIPEATNNMKCIGKETALWRIVSELP